MKHFTIFILPIVSCIYISSLNRNEKFSFSYFIEKKGNFYSNSNPFQSTFSRNRIECGVTCLNSVQCWHSFFDKETRKCNLYEKYDEFLEDSTKRFGYLLLSPKEGLTVWVFLFSNFQSSL